MKKPFYLTCAVLILTILFGTIYVVGQQILRQDANDPQIQLATDVAVQLNNGTAPDKAVGNNVDVANSLAPFVIVYDKSGKVVAGSGYLDGKVPTVPFGVLQAAAGHFDNRVTWQPKDRVRIASVTVASKDYFVLSGRNLREVEAREDHTLKLAALGWLTSIFVLAGTVWFLTPVKVQSK